MLWSLDISGMCILVIDYTKKLFGYTNKDLARVWVHNLIPLMNRDAYAYFYSNNKIVDKHCRRDLFWDSPSLFGRIRRRIYVYHLIKELKKQLK